MSLIKECQRLREFAIRRSTRRITQDTAIDGMRTARMNIVKGNAVAKKILTNTKGKF